MHCSSAPIDGGQDGSDGPGARGLWSGSALWYLGICLAGLAAGMWPDSLAHSKNANWPLPLPTLKTLALAQGLFFLVIYPLILLRRGERDAALWGPTPAAESRAGGGCPWRAAALECAILMVAAAPFYFIAGYLADARAGDVFRSALSVAALVPVGLVGGQWLLRGGAFGTAGLIVLLTAAVGLPIVFYVALEFGREGWADWLWAFTPATIVWQNGESRAAGWWQGPTWSLWVWPVLAGAMGMVGMLVERKKRP